MNARNKSSSACSDVWWLVACAAEGDLAALGERLFSDVRLSADGQTSCATCHDPSRAFADTAPVSLGAFEALGQHNTPSLFDLGERGSLGWASPQFTDPSDHVIVPLYGTEPLELGLGSVEDKAFAALNDDADLRPLAPSGITRAVMIDALVAYEMTLTSGPNQVDLGELGDAEQRGETAFVRRSCDGCHPAPRFTVDAPGAPAFANTGLYNVDGAGAYPLGDRGVYEWTGDADDMGRFRIPTLRNVAATPPYWHDGTGDSLETVVDTYAAGGRNVAAGPLMGDGRASPLKDPRVTGFTWDAGERDDLLAFLRALDSAAP